MATQSYKEVNAEDYIVDKEPFFMPTSDEVEVFQAAYNERVPILLKGPTGTGKTRFVEYMSWKINEISTEAGGLKFVYIQKTLIMLFPISLVIVLIHKFISNKWN